MQYHTLQMIELRNRGTCSCNKKIAKEYKKSGTPERAAKETLYP